MYAFCLSCPSASLALQHGGFVQREWQAAKSLVRFKLALNVFISHMARERQPGEQATLWYLKSLLNPFEWAPNF